MNELSNKVNVIITVISTFMCFPDNKGSPVLQQAEVELIDQTLCVSTYGIITSRMLCAGVMSGKRDACRVSHLTFPLPNMLYFP